MQEPVDPQNRLPPELMRRYDVVFVPRKLQKHLKLREIGSKHVGRLVSVQVEAQNHDIWLNSSLSIHAGVLAETKTFCFLTFTTEMNLQGIITHMTDVKPLLAVATYVDDDTGYEVYQTITGWIADFPKKRTTLTDCPSAEQA